MRAELWAADTDRNGAGMWARMRAERPAKNGRRNVGRTMQAGMRHSVSGRHMGRREKDLHLLRRRLVLKRAGLQRGSRTQSVTNDHTRARAHARTHPPTHSPTYPKMRAGRQAGLWAAMRTEIQVANTDMPTEMRPTQAVADDYKRGQMCPTVPITEEGH